MVVLSLKEQYIQLERMLKKTELVEIVERCKKNDRKAQKLIYESYYNRYFTLCLRYLNSHELASESVNELFYKVFTKINDLKDLSLFEGWMKKVCINICLNQIKKQKKHAHADIEDYSNHLFVDHVKNDALSTLSMKELLSMVQSLPPQMRNVFNLYIVDGYKHSDIADMLNISEGASKYHLHQAKLKLQKVITAQDSFEKKQNFKSYV